MTADDRFVRELDGWLESEGALRAPVWLHEGAIARAVHTRQRPWWLARVRSALSTGVASPRVDMRLALAITLALLALTALWFVAASQRPVPAPVGNGQILAARYLGGPKAEYLTMDADGTHERRLFEASECDQCAWWSPDGGRILMPEDVNGRLVAAIVRADGAAKVVLQPLPESTVNLAPEAWSADGSLIALAGWDDTDPGRRGVYLARPDGTELRQVSRSTDGRPHGWITFSPDGARLSFMAIDPLAPRGGGQAGDLFVVNLDGSGLRQVNPAGTKIVATVRAGRPTDWASDGGQIVFAATEGELDSRRSALYLARGDGSGARRITDAATGAHSVAWQPHGSWFLSGDANEGKESIWLLDSRTAERRTLWSSTSADAACCGTWSPDGTLILFERGPAGERDLWTMRSDGTVVGQVTHRAADYVWYSWGRASE